MPNLQKIQTATMAVAALATALLLTGCSANKVTDLFSQTPNLLPSLDTDLTPYSKASALVTAPTRPTVTAADFVGADGTCATPPADSATAQQGATGIGLGMTECGLVQLAGPPDKLDLGSNQSGERTAVMLYNRGERPGLYGFTAGQLTSIERVAAPPPPPKPKKPVKPAPPPRRAVT